MFTRDLPSFNYSVVLYKNSVYGNVNAMHYNQIKLVTPTSLYVHTLYAYNI